MYPMRTIRMTVAAIALLLTACAPAAMANTPTVANAAPTATDAVVAMAASTETATEAVATTPPTEQVAESPAATSLAAATNPNVVTTNSAALSDEAASAPAAVAQPQGSPYEILTSPVDLLASYYNAINRHEYQRAYGYWQSPPMSYQSFASGFNDTTAIQLIVQPPTSGEGAAGSTYVQVPTVLIAQHTDGSMHTYGGCFVTRKSNLQPPDIPEVDVWHINQAQLEEVSNNISIPNTLAQACQS